MLKILRWGNAEKAKEEQIRPQLCFNSLERADSGSKARSYSQKQVLRGSKRSGVQVKTEEFRNRFGRQPMYNLENIQRILKPILYLTGKKKGLCPGTS